MSRLDLMIHTEINPLNGDAIETSCEFIGDLRDPLPISPWFIRRYLGLRLQKWNYPKYLVINGLRFRFLEHRLLMGDALYVCVTLFPFRWLQLKIGTVMSHAYRWLLFRFVLTLQVWGLAWVQSGEIPSWRHIGKKR